MSRYRPELDGLRGFAAYVVVISHVSNVSGLWGTLFGEGGGQLGVMLFFMLSGFLMGSIYLPREWTAGNVLIYVRHRIARVLPLFYIVVTMALLLSWLTAATGLDLSVYPVDQSNALYHYGLISGVSVLWTIPVEMQFYIVFIAIWALARRSRLFLLAFVAPCVAVYLGIGRSFPSIELFIYYAGYFLTGILINQAVATTSPFRLGSLWSIAFVLALGFFFCLLPNVGKLIGLSFEQRWQNAAYIFGVAALFVTVLHAPLARALFANRPMRFSGRISYSIYLLHTPVLLYLERFTSIGRWPWAFALLVILATLLIAAVSFRFIEAPLQKAINMRVAAR